MRMFLFLLLLITPSIVFAESYTVVVSVDGWKSSRPISLPGYVVRYVVDEMGMRVSPDGKPLKVAEIRIKMTEKKKDTLYVLECK